MSYKDYSLLIKSLLDKSSVMVSNKSDQAEIFIKRSLDLSLKKNLRTLAGESYLQLAEYYCWVKKDYNAAIKFSAEGLKQISDSGSCVCKVDLLRVQGISCQMLELFDLAIRLYSEAIDTVNSCESLEDKSVYLATLHFNTALCYSSSSEYAPRKRHIDQAREYFKKTKNLQGVIQCEILKGSTKSECKDYLGSIESYQKALELLEPTAYENLKATCYNNLGDSYLELDRIAEAIDVLQKSLEIRMKAKNENDIHFVYHNLGLAFFKAKKYNAGLNALLRAEEYFTKEGYADRLADLFSLISKCYEALNDYKNAHIYSQKNNELMRTASAKNVSKATSILLDSKLEFLHLRVTSSENKNVEYQKYIAQLEKSNSQLKSFAHVASHDMREPLRMIYSYLMILEAKLEEKIGAYERQLIKFAASSAKRLESMIFENLEMSKLEGKNISVKVDLNDPCDTAIAHLRHTIDERGAIVIVEDLPEVFAPPAFLVQLFQNLIANAIKYNTSDNPLVDINCFVEDNFVVVIVSDNGIGIEPGELNEVFAPYRRGEKSTDNSGSGLGLTVCKRIVEQIGGTIWVEQSDSKGTEFRFRLPMVNASTLSTNAQARAMAG